MAALERLSSGSLTESALKTETSTPDAMRARKRGNVTLFVALNKAAEADECQPAFGYGVCTRGDYCQLDVEVAIPEPHQAATADPDNILVYDMKNILLPQHVLRDPNFSPARSPPSKPIHCSVKRGQYPTLVKKLMERGMVRLFNPSDNPVENSIFGVWKNPGESQRLIWSGDTFNALFHEEVSHVDLPSPAQLTSIHLPENKELRLGTCDISQF